LLKLFYLFIIIVTTSMKWANKLPIKHSKYRDLNELTKLDIISFSNREG